MNCTKIDSCSKIMAVLDKDMLDFQYADCINQICSLCTNKQVVSISQETNRAREAKMRVSDLISKLLKFDPNMMVVIPGYEGGVTEVNGLKEIKVQLNVNKEWWNGEHEESNSGDGINVVQIYGMRNKHDRKQR